MSSITLGSAATSTAKLAAGALALLVRGPAKLRTTSAPAAWLPRLRLCRIDRLLSTPLGIEGTSAYISVLIQPQGILHQGAYDGWFALALRGSTDVFFGMSYPGSTIGLEVGFEKSLTNVNAVIGQTFFGVIRIDFTEGVDPVYLYLNPQPGAPEPATPSASLINLNVNFLNMVSLTGPGGVGYDSLRIGTTYADVTPVPEPAALSLVGVAAIAVIWRQGRRRRSR
jgi:hypothetical protein